MPALSTVTARVTRTRVEQAGREEDLLAAAVDREPGPEAELHVARQTVYRAMNVLQDRLKHSV